MQQLSAALADRGPRPTNRTSHVRSIRKINRDHEGHVLYQVEHEETEKNQADDRVAGRRHRIETQWEERQDQQQHPDRAPDRQGLVPEPGGAATEGKPRSERAKTAKPSAGGRAHAPIPTRS